MIKPVLFGKFCLLERISVGGMAEVFRAKTLDSPHFNRFLAIKRILPNLSEDDEFISMFIDEAKITVQLTHRNICQIFELGNFDDSYYIVMEFISGRDILAIQNHLRRNKKIMSVGQAAYLARQIAEGLDFAHRKTDANGKPLGIIHRDISPQNCLVSYTGEVKVIDFGIAKAATRSNKTQVGVLKGKFGYMSPEQVRGKDLDRRSDVFALGTLFHEMLTCRRLFHGESDFATLEKVRKADVEPPSKFNPNIPPEIDAIVMKSLALEPADRYQWCSDFIDDLDNLFLKRLRPPYTERNLEGWMQKSFTDKLQKERQKIQFFSQFKAIEDVSAYNAELQRQMELKRSGQNPEEVAPAPEMAAQATMIWDAQKQGLFDEEADPAKDMANKSTQIFEYSEEEDVVGGGNAIERVLRAGPPPAEANPVVSNQPVGYIPPSMQHLYGTNPRATRPRRPMAGVIVGVMAAALGLLALAGGLYVIFFTDVISSAAVAQASSLTVTTEPTQEVEVLINGKLKATRTPFTADDLPPGKYTVEVRHSDFLPATKLVEVTSGEAVEVPLTLEARPVGKGTVNLTVDPPEAELYVDGEKVDQTGASRAIELDDRGEHLLEAKLPGHFVAEARIAVTDGQTVSKKLELRKVLGEIQVISTPKGTVYLDGDKVGRAPQTLEGLAPDKIYEVEIRYPGYTSWGKYVMFDRSYQKSYRVKLRPGSGGTDHKKPEVGHLTVEGGETWWRVLVNGFDTGMTTPLAESDKLTLTPGKHTLQFVRGDQSHTREVDIKAGETTHLQVDYAFKR